MLPPRLARRHPRDSPNGAAGTRPAGAWRSTPASVSGFLRFWLLAKLRRFRPRTYRFAGGAARDRGLARARSSRPRTLSADLALEVAECARLIKGYGDTWKRGVANYRLIEAHVIAPGARRPHPAAAGDRRDRERAHRRAASIPKARAWRNAWREIDAQSARRDRGGVTPGRSQRFTPPVACPHVADHRRERSAHLPAAARPAGAGARRRLARRAHARVPRAARPVRLRQVDPALSDRRIPADRGRPHPDRRQAGRGTRARIAASCSSTSRCFPGRRCAPTFSTGWNGRACRAPSAKSARRPSSSWSASRASRTAIRRSSPAA